MLSNTVNEASYINLKKFSTCDVAMLAPKGTSGLDKDAALDQGLAEALSSVGVAGLVRRQRSVGPMHLRSLAISPTISLSRCYLAIFPMQLHTKRPLGSHGK